jgi:hypothetical protein
MQKIEQEKKVVEKYFKFLDLYKLDQLASK